MVFAKQSYPFRISEKCISKLRFSSLFPYSSLLADNFRKWQQRQSQLLLNPIYRLPMFVFVFAVNRDTSNTTFANGRLPVRWWARFGLRRRSVCLMFDWTRLDSSAGGSRIDKDLIIEGVIPHHWHPTSQTIKSKTIGDTMPTKKAVRPVTLANEAIPLT